MRNAIEVRRVIDGRIYERKVPLGGSISTDEVIRLLGISRRTLFYWVSRGVLAPRRVRGHLRFPLAEALRVQRKKGGDTP